jgi:hypothetical protein
VYSLQARAGDKTPRRRKRIAARQQITLGISGGNVGSEKTSLFSEPSEDFQTER